MSDVSLRDFYNRYYRPIQLAQASCDCKKQYLQNIRKADDAAGGTCRLSDLSDDLLARVCGRLLSEGRSPATANKVRSQLVALWNFAARRGLVTTWPTLRKYREYKREPTAWTREQLTRLFAVAASRKGSIGRVPASLWWLTLLSLLWDTGLRIGAAMQLRWQQVDFERGYVLALAEQQKQGADQWFRLHPDTLKILRLLEGYATEGCQEKENGPIFRWPRAICTLWNAYKDLLTAAELPNGRRDKFHRIRRSVATHYEVAGGNATELLGHSCRAVTKSYLDATITGKVWAADLLFRPDGRDSA
jgi:integrase